MALRRRPARSKRARARRGEAAPHRGLLLCGRGRVRAGARALPERRRLLRALPGVTHCLADGHACMLHAEHASRRHGTAPATKGVIHFSEMDIKGTGRRACSGYASRSTPATSRLQRALTLAAARAPGPTPAPEPHACASPHARV